MPATFLIDRNGRVIRRALTIADISDEVKKIK
jgi:hypothetical protein